MKCVKVSGGNGNQGRNNGNSYVAAPLPGAGTLLTEIDIPRANGGVILKFLISNPKGLC